MANMTYVQALDAAIETMTLEEVRDKLTALREQLEKRRSGERKPTKTQKENENIKAEIANVLSDVGMQAKDVGAAVNISSQKAAALLKQMVEAGLADKYTEKRVTYFKAVA